MAIKGVTKSGFCVNGVLIQGAVARDPQPRCHGLLGTEERRGAANMLVVVATGRTERDDGHRSARIGVASWLFELPQVLLAVFLLVAVAKFRQTANSQS